MAAYEFSRTPRKVPLVSTEHRLIKTEIPAPGTAEILARIDAVESRSMHGQLPIVWSNARNFNVWDNIGNKFIDFTSGIFVANVGHSNDRVYSATKPFLTLVHSYTYATEIRAEYLEKLTSWSGFEKAFLVSSGTESTEAALKLMRLYGQKAGKRRPGIICIEGNWHGRTMGAQMMSSDPRQKAWIGLQDPNITYLPFPRDDIIAAMEDDGTRFFEHYITRILPARMLTDADLCGVMLETFQGWGALFYPVGFVQAIERFCREYGLLLCFDEMQSGFARTGKKFGYEHYGVTPDLICVGKGMGGGVPLSGVLGSAAIMDLPEVGEMSSTHSANPLCCAAGLAVINEIERLDLVNESARKGKLLHHILGELPGVRVYGKGMIAAVHFDNTEKASRVAERCMEKGLIVVHTGRESIKIGPPLTIADDALIEGVKVLGEAISEIRIEMAS